MAGGNNDATLREVHRLFAEGTVSGLSETQLLERFLARRDEVAFEALVSRHGPMVLGVCRRLLRDPHAIDDAFQATFLILVRKARSLRAPQLLGPWLHGVAYRVALRSRTVAARRSSREAPYTETAVVPEDDFDNDIRPVIDEELSRLPEPYRAALVLCYLEGHTHHEAAERLRCPVGTVRSRLARGRERLRHRLIRRGLAPAAGFLATEVLGPRASAAVPPILMHSTVVAATRYAAGQLIAAGVVSASAAALTQGVLTTMFLSKLQVVAVGVLILGLAGGGARFAAQQGAVAAQAPDGPGVVDQPKQQAAPKDDLELLQGVWQVTETVPKNASDKWLVGETWKIQGSKLTIGQKNFVFHDKDGGRVEGSAIEVFETIGLVQQATPKRISISAPGSEGNRLLDCIGIYQLNEDHLRVLLVPEQASFPTDFSEKPGNLYIDLKRQPPLKGKAQTKHEVLEKYTKVKTIKELNSAVEKARADVLAAEANFQRAKGALEQAQAKASVTPGSDTPKKPPAPANAPPLSQPVDKNPPAPAAAPPEEPKPESMAAKALGLRLKAARKELERYEELYKRQSIPLAILQEMRSKVDVVVAEIDSEQERLSDELELMGPRLEVKRAELRLAEAQSPSGGGGTGRMAVAEGNSQIDVKKAELREVEVRMRQLRRKLDQIERLKKEVEPPQPK